MKNILTLTLVFLALPCFAQEKILYSDNGVIFGYQYEKIGAAIDKDCPDIKFDEYRIIVKVKNTNNQAIDLTDLGGRFYLNSESCTTSGNLKSDSVSYGAGLFSPHRNYGTATPNTNFGAVHSYFLDAKDEYMTLPGMLKVRNGNSFPEPDWYFPKWKFIDLPNKESISAGKITPKSSNISTEYEKLIVGKWRFSQSSTLKHGNEIEIYEEEDACFDSYETNKRMVINIGDCNNAEEGGKWTIAGNIVTTFIDGDVTKYEILQLDKSTLRLKSMTEHNAGSYFISTFKRVAK